MSCYHETRACALIPKKASDDATANPASDRGPFAGLV